MRTLRVAARDLLFALDNRAPGTTHYLDTETGDVVPVFAFNRDRILAEARQFPRRFLRLAPQAGREGFQAMQDFCRTVSRLEYRRRLEAVLSGRGVFRAFRAVLEEDPRELARWQQFRSYRMVDALREKLTAQGIALELVSRD